VLHLIILYDSKFTAKEQAAFKLTPGISVKKFQAD